MDSHCSLQLALLDSISCVHENHKNLLSDLSQYLHEAAASIQSMVTLHDGLGWKARKTVFEHRERMKRMLASEATPILNHMDIETLEKSLRDVMSAYSQSSTRAKKVRRAISKLCTGTEGEESHKSSAEVSLKNVYAMVAERLAREHLHSQAQRTSRQRMDWSSSSESDLDDSMPAASVTKFDRTVQIEKTHPYTIPDPLNPDQQPETSTFRTINSRTSQVSKVKDSSSNPYSKPDSTATSSIKATAPNILQYFKPASHTMQTRGMKRKRDVNTLDKVSDIADRDNHTKRRGISQHAVLNAAERVAETRKRAAVEMERAIIRRGERRSTGCD